MKIDTLSWILIVLANWYKSPHVALHKHLMLNQSQPVFAHTPKFWVLSREVENTIVIVFGWKIQSNLK